MFYISKQGELLAFDQIIFHSFTDENTSQTKHSEINSRNIAAVKPKKVSSEHGAGFQRVHLKDGVIYFEDGREVTLWGVNFQSCMSWEHNRIRSVSGQHRNFDLESYEKMVLEGFDEIQKMGCDLIRVHLSPADYTDNDGNITENPWTHMLDMTMAECRKRGIYVNLSLLNHLGQHNKKSPFAIHKEKKWKWMITKDGREHGERFVRQLMERQNPLDARSMYRKNPAWIVAEIMNEPHFPVKMGEDAGVDAIYRDWLQDNGRKVTESSFRAFAKVSYLNYMNRMKRVIEDAGFMGVVCWNLLWSQGPKHMSWAPFEAFSESNLGLCSFSTYPGQHESSKMKPAEVAQVNQLGYLLKSYHKEDWQGWLREPGYRGKARIVYEYESWHTQSAHLYPLMAKYFKAQGAQMATMWTYTFSDSAPYFSPERSHFLNLISTPKKAASFVVAGEVFRSEKRLEPLSFKSDVMDSNAHYAASYKSDTSYYSDEDSLYHAGNISASELKSRSPKRIAGYGTSPWLDSERRGMYFLERTPKLWSLELMPHSTFRKTPIIEPNQKRRKKMVELWVDIEPSQDHRVSIRQLPKTDVVRVVRIDGDKTWKVDFKRERGALSFVGDAGKYEIYF
jgi:hypothetical protein